MAGAKQWRIKCPHVADRPSDRAMASEVTDNNKGHWQRENRIPDGVDASDLGILLERYTGHVLCCNSCRRVMTLSDGELTVHHGPDPYCRRWGYPGDGTWPGGDS
jgi:hypothetical protein